MWQFSIVVTRVVNETLAYETETRLRHSVFGARRDQDQDLPAIPRDRDETETSDFCHETRPRPRPCKAETETFSRPSTFSIVPNNERRRSNYKNSSGDEIANVNFYAVRLEATRIR